MRRYRLGSHAKYDLKVHLVWCPKYRKRVLTGQVASLISICYHREKTSHAIAATVATISRNK